MTDNIARLLALMGGSGGSGGGTSDYGDLNNKPQINGTTLVGNKSGSALGLANYWEGTQAQYAQAAATIPAGTLVRITDDTDMDSVPTKNSSNPVTSNGIYNELAKLKVINENSENHNGIYRGRNLSDVYTWDEIYERVHDGSFEDLYLGDYKTTHLVTDLYTRFTGSAFVEGTTYYEMGGTVIARTWTETQDAEPQSGKVYATKQIVEEDVDYMIAGFDIFLHTGHTVPGDQYAHYVRDHHLVLIPRTHYTTPALMNADGTALTGYANSDMNQITLPCYVASTKIAVNDHLLPRVARLGAAVDPNVPSAAGAGYNGATTNASGMWIYSALMNDIQVFGTTALSSSFYEIGLDYERFPVFQFVSPVEMFEPTDTASTWLRTVALVRNISSIGNVVYYSQYTGGGSVAMNAAMGTGVKVRPYFLFG